MAKVEDILIEFIEHPWFRLFYKDLLDNAIRNIENSILDPEIEEDDDRKYSKTQLNRLLVKRLKTLKNNPVAQLKTYAVSQNDTVAQYAKKKATQLS